MLIFNTGEDGDEMSAAGQNETFLGVKRFEQVNFLSILFYNQFSLCLHFLSQI